MEPYIMPLHSSSPPPLDDDGDGDAGSEEEEFGDFGAFSVGVSCSPLGLADSAELPSSLRQPSPTKKPATHPTSCSFNHPVEQSQPASAVKSGSGRGHIDIEGRDCDAESSLHLTNGYAEGHHNSEAWSASIGGTCSPKEETGFADFTVFTEQAAHPWCCGFSPIDSVEQWADRAEGTNLGQQIYDPDHEVITDSEPRSQCAYKAKETVCTKVKHCEKRDAAPSQDHHHHQPQEAAAASPFPPEQPHCGEEDAGKQEDDEQSGSAVPQTLSAYESASEDLASLCDDLSFEGVSADLEPNVSSLASQEDQTDWDQTDVEDEEVGIYRRSDCCVNSSMAVLSQSEAEEGFHRCNHSATQETSATSNRSPSVTHTGDEFADFSNSSSEHHRDQEHVQTADEGVQSLGSLPPSDSFADFCSASTQEDGERLWAEFQDQRAQEEGKTWTQVRVQVSSSQTDGYAEDRPDRVGQCGVLRRNSCQASLSCRVQQLLWASFPEVVVPAVEGEEEALNLGALLHTQHLPKSEEEKVPELSGAQRVQRGPWWLHHDVHSALGLRFQWGGSHTSRSLFRCLGVDTRNIVFTGMRKQPVSVPAFASSLGMLEPTKDPVSVACSPGHTTVTAQTPVRPQDTTSLSAHSAQEAVPSSQLDWSSRGLSSSQDGGSALNLDYFGPGEESRSSSNTPPPGVDRELYELTVSKLETSTHRCHLEDTLKHLMSTAEKTCTSGRKPQQVEELSAEAGRVTAGLPNLSFMRAQVLMFPSILVPKECSPSVF